MEADMCRGMQLVLVLTFLVTMPIGCKQETQKPNPAPPPASSGSVSQAAACGCPADFKDAAAFTTYVRYGEDGDFYEVTANDVNGKAVLEGDVILGSTSDMKKLARDIGAVGGLDEAIAGIRALRVQSFRGEAEPNQAMSLQQERALERIEGHKSSVQAWPSRRVPYIYGNGIVQGSNLQKAIKKAMDDWEAKAEVDFTEKLASDTRFITFIPASGDACYWDGAFASLSAGCARHEIGHALGLMHEHTRNDRDGVVKVNRENIKSKHCSQFRKNTIISAICGKYDFTSVMHYDPYAFSCNGKVTIQALGNNKIEYDGYKISAGDIKAVRAIHGLEVCN
jgi:hypothetical protein